jgi:hypothetical protein
LAQNNLNIIGSPTEALGKLLTHSILFVIHSFPKGFDFAEAYSDPTQEIEDVDADEN